ncbi:hypothetical protein ACWDR2_41280 [Streptomyces sp. NPDC003631]|uniref:Uncharacterized protein n=2 Tax=Streptomyces TaxID=1883 RepID=A0ABP7M3C3_9ACTN
MDITPPLPIAQVFRTEMNHDGPLSATQAHQVLLYCALDAACVPMDPLAVQAVVRLAQLDYPTVQAVIDWITTAGTPRP